MIASPSYNHDTLQWITEKEGDGQWTIQSLSTEKRYLGFKNTAPKDGTIIFGVDRPQLWDIEILSDSDDHDNPRVRYVSMTYPIGDDRS